MLRRERRFHDIDGMMASMRQIMSLLDFLEPAKLWLHDLWYCTRHSSYSSSERELDGSAARGLPPQKSAAQHSLHFRLGFGSKMDKTFYHTFSWCPIHFGDVPPACLLMIETRTSTTSDVRDTNLEISLAKSEEQSFAKRIHLRSGERSHTLTRSKNHRNSLMQRWLKITMLTDTLRSVNF